MHQAAKLVREDELLRLLLAGHMLKECAPRLNLSYATIRKYVREGDFMGRLRSLSNSIYERIDEELRQSKESITEKLEEASDRALEEMIKLATSSPQDGIRLKASQDLLDRNPQVSRTKKLEAVTGHRFLDPLYLIHAAKTAKEIETNANEQKALSDGDSAE